MNPTLQTRTKEILDHHLAAFMDASTNEILKDFTEQSELLTPQGPLKGLDAIRSFFDEIFKAIPKGSTLEIKQEIIRNNIAYIVWSADSTFINIPIGTDSFVMEDDGKIKYQALAAHIVPKG